MSIQVEDTVKCSLTDKDMDAMHDAVDIIENELLTSGQMYDDWVNEGKTPEPLSKLDEIFDSPEDMYSWSE